MEIESSSLTNIFPEKQRPILFDNNCGIPSLKSFNLTRTEPIEVTLFYDPPPPGYQPII
jgi:heat shock protein 4